MLAQRHPAVLEAAVAWAQLAAGELVRQLASELDWLAIQVVRHLPLEE